METNLLKEKIKIAEKAVEDMKDPDLKKKAFEVILNKLVSPVEKTQAEKKESVIATLKTEELPTEKDEKERVFNPERLLEATGFTLEKLSNILDFDKNQFHVVASIPGKSHAEKQKNAALLILTTYYYCTGEREYDSGKLRRMMQDLGIKSLINMATLLQNFENYFIKKGKPGSRTTVYRITNPGLQEGVNLIKQIGDKYE